MAQTSGGSEPRTAASGLGRIVPRRRLLHALRTGRIGVVEAGAGYGKSVLAADLSDLATALEGAEAPAAVEGRL